jgi:hypothetical protein
VSCRTAYLVRVEDGSIRMATAKYGAWLLKDRAALDHVLAHVRDCGAPLDNIGDGAFDGVHCQGAALDLPARRFRCFPCSSDLVRLDDLDRTIRAADVWMDWDAGIAVGGREELAAMLPEAARVVQPYDVLDSDAPSLRTVPRDDKWFVRWDPAAFKLIVRHDWNIANWDTQDFDLVTVIGPDLTGLHFRLVAVDTDPIHPLLIWLRHGPTVVDALVAEAPFPPAYEENIRTGVVVDRSREVIEYRLTHLVPARLLEAVRAAWPGWQLRPVGPGAADQPSISGEALRWPHISVVQGQSEES